MKLEWRLMLGTAIFLLAICVIYLFTSAEPTGTVLLAFGGIAYVMLFAFVFLQYRRRKGIPRPEDRYDGKAEDALGAIDYFPATSIWPVSLGLGFVLVAVGLVYGAWFFAIGGILLVGGVIGYNVESEASK